MQVGRAAMRNVPELVPRLVALLSSDQPKVATRAVGALHNVSSDAEVIRVIRRCALHGWQACYTKRSALCFWSRVPWRSAGASDGIAV